MIIYMKSEKNQEALLHNQHLIDISCTLTKLNNMCLSFKNKKTLSCEKIFLVKQAIADISKDKEQLQASLKTLLINNGITKPKTLNNQQISDNFLKDLQILYKNYVILETKKVNNKYSELKKHRKNEKDGCCSIF